MSDVEWWLLAGVVLGVLSAIGQVLARDPLHERAARALTPLAIVAVAVALWVSPL
jgi:energy-converting hydrogenase Eha subunit C